MSARVTFLALLVLLAGCGPQEGTVIIVRASGVNSTGGSEGCAQPIDRFLDALDQDRRAGRLSQTKFDQARGDMRTIRTTCETGSEPDAIRQLGVVKARYGYQ